MYAFFEPNYASSSYSGWELEMLIADLLALLLEVDPQSELIFVMIDFRLC